MGNIANKNSKSCDIRPVYEPNISRTDLIQNESRARPEGTNINNIFTSAVNPRDPN